MKENVVHWRFKGKSKIHQTRYFAAESPDEAALAAAANDLADANQEDGLAVYNQACANGKAVIVSEP